jgi:hypothetical protein
VIVGTVESYFSGKVDAALTFPASSRQVPEMEAPPESGPSYEAVLHDAIPEIASDPPNDSVTGLLNQPFASGARAGVIPVTLGGSLSILKCTVKSVEPVSSDAVHLSGGWSFVS